MSAVFTLLLICITVSVISSQNCHNNTIINDCSVPAGFKWYKNRFRPACDKHDVCYRCGYTLKVPRIKCDNAFKKNMEKTCPKKKKGSFSFIKNLVSKRTECMTAALTYYSAVRAGGGMPMYWDYKKFSICRESWVKECMP